MRNDYKLKGELKKLEVEVEKMTVDNILDMEKQTKLTRSELVNTALKRFISAHKDFRTPKSEH